MSDKIANWTSSDDAMVESAIRRGASRRELLQMMFMGGIAATTGATILGRATVAVAAEPVKGGFIKAAGFSASTADTLDPAKASNATDYVRCSALYNRLRSEEHTSELQSRQYLVCRLLLEKKKYE